MDKALLNNLDFRGPKSKLSYNCDPRFQNGTNNAKALTLFSISIQQTSVKQLIFKAVDRLVTIHIFFVEKIYLLKQDTEIQRKLFNLL